jgi:predicted ABC-class ATPase
VAKEKLKKYKDLQKLKAVIKKEIRNITRKPGKNIQIDYAIKIQDIQDKYVVSFGRVEKKMRKLLPALIKQTTDPVKKAELERELSLESLSEMPLEKLRELSIQFWPKKRRSISQRA